MEETRITKAEDGWIISIDGKLYHSSGSLEDAVTKSLQIRQYLQAKDIKADD